jgi:hypothetical protein
MAWAGASKTGCAKGTSRSQPRHMSSRRRCATWCPRQPAAHVARMGPAGTLCAAHSRRAGPCRPRGRGAGSANVSGGGVAPAASCSAACSAAAAAGAACASGAEERWVARRAGMVARGPLAAASGRKPWVREAALAAVKGRWGGGRVLSNRRPTACMPTLSHSVCTHRPWPPSSRTSAGSHCSAEAAPAGSTSTGLSRSASVAPRRPKRIGRCSGSRPAPPHTPQRAQALPLLGWSPPRPRGGAPASRRRAGLPAIPAEAEWLVHLPSGVLATRRGVAQPAAAAAP